jgi:hypothetical protein
MEMRGIDDTQTVPYYIVCARYPAVFITVRVYNFLVVGIFACQKREKESVTRKRSGVRITVLLFY